MAQYFKLEERKESKIFKSVRRIAEYYIRASKYITRLQKDFNQEFIYKKEVMKLPDTYKMDKNTFVVLNVGKYELQDPEMRDVNFEVKVECHIDEGGRILGAYAVI